MKITLLLLLLLLRPEARDRTPAADSLRAWLDAHTQVDTARLRRLNALGNELRIADTAQSRALYEEALKLARRKAASLYQGQALLGLSACYRFQENYVRAYSYAQQARQLFAGLKNHRELAKALIQLSGVQRQQGNYAPALAFALQALPEARLAHDRESQTVIELVLGATYFYLNDYTTAIAHQQLALQQALEIKDNRLIATSLNDLGEVYMAQEQLQKALDYFQRSQPLMQIQHDATNLAIIESNLSSVYRRLGDSAQAQAHGRQAVRFARQAFNGFALPPAEVALARAYLLAQKPDSAIRLARGTFRRAQQRGAKQVIADATEVLAQAYAQYHNFAAAYHFQKLHAAVRDVVAGAQIQRQASAQLYTAQLRQKQVQIELLQKRRQLARQQLFALIGGLLALVLLAALLVRNNRLKQRTIRHEMERNEQIATQRDALETTLSKLRTTQQQLVHREKLASLGALTAGIAHEIQNPLNFVNNFSELSLELVEELQQELTQDAPDPGVVEGLTNALKINQERINQHGKRADSIVKGMLQHSRANSGERTPTDLNALCDEYLRLSYHGLRAKDPTFNVVLTTDLDPKLGPVDVVPQDLSRVLLNLFTNAFHAVTEKKKARGDSFQPEVKVTTRKRAGIVEIRVRDNGNGVPLQLVEKIFEPFFTTKPAGEGTGLGLSLSFDIVTKGHEGTLTVQTQEGEYAEFMITLPIPVPVSAPSPALQS